MKTKDLTKLATCIECFEVLGALGWNLDVTYDVGPGGVEVTAFAPSGTCYGRNQAENTHDAMRETLEDLQRQQNTFAPKPGDRLPFAVEVADVVVDVDDDGQTSLLRGLFGNH